MLAFFDTSALFKRYAEEDGSERVRVLAAQTDQLAVAAHCKVEIASALNRQRHDGLITSDFYTQLMAEVHQDFAEFSLVPLSARVEALAIAATERSRLRAMDALHVASALAARVDLFVTGDKQQAQAARDSGLVTEVIGS